MIQKLAVLFGALLAAAAPGLSMEVQRKIKPDAFDFGGYLHQVVGRTFEALQTDAITLTVMFVGCVWLLNRYLFHKPRHTGFGEYLLCAFFSGMQLLCAVTRQVGTVAVLWENAFQLIKAALYLLGMYLLLLCLLRALGEALQNGFSLRRLEKYSCVGYCRRMWEKRPFLFPFLLLCVAWLPHLIIRYPGQLTIDTVLQAHQYLLWRPRSTPHPPLGTVIYGTLIDFTLTVGHKNLIYFAFTLLKTAGFIAILSYSLLVMKKCAAPGWVRLLALTLYAVSPIYVGWTTTLSKDSSFLILCILASAMALEFVLDMEDFIRSWKRMTVLAVDLILMMLVRHNGVFVAVPLLAAMALCFLVRRRGRQGVLTLLYAAVVIGFSVGAEEYMIRTMDITRVSQDDWLSLPFQQTARVVKLHGDELPKEEVALIDRVMDFDQVPELYEPNSSDNIRWSENAGRAPEDILAYLKGAWAKELVRYPVEYLDAALAMNAVLFDLQSNEPLYVSLTDNTNDSYVYPHSFNDMWYYDREELVALNSLQRALTEWYFRFSDLPLIGPFASMGFCMLLMMSLIYLSMVNRRRKTLMVMIPALITGIAGPFLPLVYLRYLLPMVGTVPLWLAAYTAPRLDRGAPPPL